MLSYPILEAEDLLKGKLSTAKETLENCEEDLDFLRQQITVRASLLLFLHLPLPRQPCHTTGGPLNQPGKLTKLISFYYLTPHVQTLEVNTARIYNWDVTMKRKEKAGAI